MTDAQNKYATCAATTFGSFLFFYTFLAGYFWLGKPRCCRCISVVFLLSLTACIVSDSAHCHSPEQPNPVRNEAVAKPLLAVHCYVFRLPPYWQFQNDPGRHEQLSRCEHTARLLGQYLIDNVFCVLVIINFQNQLTASNGTISGFANVTYPAGCAHPSTTPLFLGLLCLVTLSIASFILL